MNKIKKASYFFFRYSYNPNCFCELDEISDVGGLIAFWEGIDQNIGWLEMSRR